MTPTRSTPIRIWASSSVFGSRQVASEEVDIAFGMPPGKLRHRAGIVSVAHAAEGEREIHLAARAAAGALEAANCSAKHIQWLFATSETHRSYPSLAAELHSRLDLPKDCGALDVGGACLGLLHALQAASSFLQNGPASAALVVTADVHSRILLPGRVPGEFGGLFGDGASAFVLGRDDGHSPESRYRLSGLFFGCSSQYAEAIRVDETPGGEIELQFDGEALSRAAISRMAGLIAEIESRSGIPRSSAQAFATHQPNPRLVALLAKQLGVPADRFPAIAQTRGNLGSSTCAAALHEAIAKTPGGSEFSRQPIFLASLGPGLLTGAGWLVREAENQLRGA